MGDNGGRSMKRTQIQLDDATYEAVRRRAYERNRSMSSVVREALAKAFGVEPGVEKRKWTIEDFTFIGTGSDPDNRPDAPVSENHDDALAEAYADWNRPGRK